MYCATLWERSWRHANKRCYEAGGTGRNVAAIALRARSFRAGDGSFRTVALCAYHVGQGQVVRLERDGAARHFLLRKPDAYDAHIRAHA